MSESFKTGRAVYGMAWGNLVGDLIVQSIQISWVHGWTIHRVLRSTISWMRDALRNRSSSWVEFASSMRVEGWLSSRVRLESRIWMS